MDGSANHSNLYSQNLSDRNAHKNNNKSANLFSQEKWFFKPQYEENEEVRYKINVRAANDTAFYDVDERYVALRGYIHELREFQPVLEKELDEISAYVEAACRADRP